MERGGQELGGSARFGWWSRAPGGWESPGMQQELPGASMARGMGRWAAAQGGSLGAHTLFWHLQGVASPLIAA